MLVLYVLKANESCVVLQETPENEAIGMQYLVDAAERGLRPAMFEVAKALDTGMNSGGR